MKLQTRHIKPQGKLKGLTGHTRIVGVIGDPVEHSRSPQMHNAAFAKAELDYVYVPFHVRPDDLADAIAGFKAVNVVGINVTLPHKQAVIPFLTSISREAELIGAVNTLSFTDGEIHGDNTDAPGVLRALEENQNMSVPVGENVVVLGAGGCCESRGCCVGTRWCRIDFNRQSHSRKSYRLSRRDGSENRDFHARDGTCRHTIT